MAWIQRVTILDDANATSSKVMTVNNLTTVGHRLILSVKGSSGIAVSSVTDSRGNTWTVDQVSTNTTGARETIASSVLTTALLVGDTITAALTAAGVALLSVQEYSGFSGAVVDVAAQNNSAGANAISAAVTTLNANDLIFTAGVSGVAGTTATVPTGFTVRDSGENGVADGCLQTAELIVSATGTYTANWTFNTTGAVACGVVAYKATAAVAAAPGGFFAWFRT